MVRAFRICLVVILLFVLASTLGWVYTGVQEVNASDPSATDQGCVNQGSDRRIAAPVVCGMQRRFSWKSEHKPHVLQIGHRGRTNMAIAWPPYVVINKRQHGGRWLMFRAGFRYDRTWHGYIFPTAALKSIDHSLLY